MNGLRITAGLALLIATVSGPASAQSPPPASGAELAALDPATDPNAQSDVAPERNDGTGDARGSDEPIAQPAPEPSPGAKTAAGEPGAPTVPAADATLLEEGAGKRPYYLSGTIELRSLAIIDDDPANDIGVIWRAEAGITAFENATAFVRLGLLQRFVGVDNTPPTFAQENLGIEEDLDVQTLRPFNLQDMQVGLRYEHSVDPSGLGIEAKSLDFIHQVSFFVPTSIASQRQSLILAPELRTQAWLGIIDRLTLIADLKFQYRFHRWAERAGRDAGLNTQLVLQGALTLDYLAYENDDVGEFNVGVGAYLAPYKKYPSRDSHLSDSSDANLWLQDYGWNLYVSYAPISWFSATVSVEQGGPVLRDGIVNTFLFKREETEFVLTLVGKY